MIYSHGVRLLSWGLSWPDLSVKVAASLEHVLSFDAVVMFTCGEPMLAISMFFFSMFFGSALLKRWLNWKLPVEIFSRGYTQTKIISVVHYVYNVQMGSWSWHGFPLRSDLNSMEIPPRSEYQGRLDIFKDGSTQTMPLPMRVQRPLLKWPHQILALLHPYIFFLEKSCFAKKF